MPVTKDLNDAEVRSSSESEGSVEVYKETKVPWWGYVWASTIEAQD